MSDHKTAVGVCEAVASKGEWREYAIRVEGMEWPVKLSTKAMPSGHTAAGAGAAHT